jgi:hypothetical protein
MGQATMAITGDLSKQTSIFIGKASLSISGILDTAVISLQATGGAVMSIIGSLARQFIAGAGIPKFLKPILSSILRKILK